MEMFSSIFYQFKNTILEKKYGIKMNNSLN